MFETMTEQEILAKLIYGEAEGEPIEGKIAVAWTVRNRVFKGRWWGHTYREVMLKPYQFSCFNNNSVAERLPVTATNLFIAEGVMKGVLPDLSHQATHYHAKSVNPKWAKALKSTTVIGNHIFYKAKAKAKAKR